MPSLISLDADRGTLTVGDLIVDLNVVEAICQPDKRLLWRFLIEDGVVQAIPYSENEVIWIEPKA